MITAFQLNSLTQILAAQGFRWENSYADRAIYTNGSEAEIYWLTVYLTDTKPIAQLRKGEEFVRIITGETYEDFEHQIKVGVIPIQINS